MTILKIEIDTQDMFGDGYNDETFCDMDELIKNAVTQEIKKDLAEKCSADAFKDTCAAISIECVNQVESKLSDLINEDIVTTDRWGKPDFIGSVEDYIKREIDSKIMNPVDSQGNKLEGCSRGGSDTWLEYHVKKKIEGHLRVIDRQLEKIADNHCKNAIDKKILAFKKAGLNELIMERLKAAGVE